MVGPYLAEEHPQVGEQRLPAVLGLVEAMGSHFVPMGQTECRRGKSSLRCLRSLVSPLWGRAANHVD